MPVMEKCRYALVVDRICGLRWQHITAQQLIDVAWAYYYFSVQFRENLTIACRLFPDDTKLQLLHQEECLTDNLSPWPGVAAPAEKMNHDEFMRRTLLLAPVDDEKRRFFDAEGARYLALVRQLEPLTRALSIASYEDGGLESVFGAFLRAQHWDNPALMAFQHFLSEHIRFDSNPDLGHGALSRHLIPDDRILPLWEAFEHLLVTLVPRLQA
jgi:hypothetical protein